MQVNKFCPVELMNCEHCFDDNCDALGVTTNLKYLDGSVLYEECVAPGKQQPIVPEAKDYLQHQLSNIFTAVKIKTGNIMVGNWQVALNIFQQVYNRGRADMKGDCIKVIRKLMTERHKKYGIAVTEESIIAAIESISVEK